MTPTKSVLLAFICLTLMNCKTEENKFPVTKRYWDVQDYDKIVRELRFGYKNDDKLPRFDDPEQRIIVEKLTDNQNFKVVLDDEELGLNHRNNIATEFFNNWKDMIKIYNATDRKDKYVYEKEMLAVWQFGLDLQLRYFKLGNDQIIATADDPKSSGVINSTNSNVSTLVSNYMIYLDEINTEDAFSEEGKIIFSKGIETSFVEMVQIFPDANYTSLKAKSELMLKKTQSDPIKSWLRKLIEIIDSKSEKKAV